MVTHPSTNCAQCRETTFIETNKLLLVYKAMKLFHFGMKNKTQNQLHVRQK